MAGLIREETILDDLGWSGAYREIGARGGISRGEACPSRAWGDPVAEASRRRRC
jgi:hypothetical protein